jgi:deoxynucleoside triphosphate triphosphohydrolase SAMHD1
MPMTLRAKAASVERVEDEASLLEPKRSMSVQDMIYGQIEFPPVIRLLTDSPIVQRLRDLKQLGNSFYIYPSATHSRFEHSLGVCYLAMDLYSSIVDGHREDHRNFGVPQIAQMPRETIQKDMQCIGIAGLCHDLGHGPLSHMFESFVRSSAGEHDSLRTWSHEQASILLLRKLWHDNADGLTQLGFDETDLRYVELLINGLRPGKPWPDNVGRGSWARFTTEIVANKRNGLDVDKIDYIQRDSVACLGTPTFVSMRRLFQGARVVMDSEGETSIGFPDKLDGVIEEIFLARAHLHRIVYQHRVTKIIDLMMLDALRAAGDVFMVTDGHGEQLPLRTCPLHPDFYIHASDWIVLAILHSSSDALAEARSILERIQSRQLYTTIGSYRYNEKTLMAAAKTRAVTGSSQQVKHKVMLDELGRDIDVTAPKLAEKLRKWSETHGKLHSIEILQAEITQSAGDMNKMMNPVEATYFFNARQSANYPVEPHYTCNATTSLSSQQGPVSSIVVVCRMPLTPSEKETLRFTFTAVADRLGKTDTNSFSCSPHASQRGRGTSCSQRDSTARDDEATPPQTCVGEWLRSPAVKRLKLEMDGTVPEATLNGVSSSSTDLLEGKTVADDENDEAEIL